MASKLLVLALAALCVSAAQAAKGACEYAASSGCTPSYYTLLSIIETKSDSPIDR
jgi:hypothetical protein